MDTASKFFVISWMCDDLVVVLPLSGCVSLIFGARGKLTEL